MKQHLIKRRTLLSTNCYDLFLRDFGTKYSRFVLILYLNHFMQVVGVFFSFAIWTTKDSKRKAKGCQRN